MVALWPEILTLGARSADVMIQVCRLTNFLRSHVGQSQYYTMLDSHSIIPQAAICVFYYDKSVDV